MFFFMKYKSFLNNFFCNKPNRLSVSFVSALPYFISDQNSSSNIETKLDLNFNDSVDSIFLDTYRRDSIFFLKTSNLNLLDNFYSNLFLHFKDVSLFYKILEIDWYTSPLYVWKYFSLDNYELFRDEVIYLPYFIEIFFFINLLIILFIMIHYNLKKDFILFLDKTRLLLDWNLFFSFFSLYYLLNNYKYVFNIFYKNLDRIFIPSIDSEDLLSFFYILKFNCASLGNAGGKLLFNRLFIIDEYTYLMKFSLLVCFIVINVVLVLWYTSVSKGILFNTYVDNTKDINQSDGFLSINNLIPLKISILNLKFLRNFALFSNFAVFFLLNLISSYNLLSFFVSIEGATLCLYVLAGLKTNNRLSIEAGLKYFLISAVFSCILGFGLFLIYFTTGSVDFYEIREVLLMMTLFSEKYNFMFLLSNIGLFLILIVFLMKLGAVPYHFWLGDIYQGSPLIVTAFFATVVRVAFFAIFIRLFAYVFYFPLSIYFYSILCFFGILSIIYGSILSLAQSEIKRFLAYSSIVHTGFILIAVGTMTSESNKAAIFYLLIYIYTLLSFFFILLTIQAIFPFKKNNFNNSVFMYYLRDFKYFSDLSLLPLGTQYFMIFLLFSMAGLPPFPGFLIKLYVFKSFFNELFFSLRVFFDFNFYNIYFFVIFLVFFFFILISFLTAYNYIRLIIKMSFSNNKFFFNKKSITTSLSYNTNNLYEEDRVVFILFFLLFHIILILYTSFFFNYERSFFDFSVESLRHPFFFMDNIAKIFLDFCTKKYSADFNNVSSLYSFFDWFWSSYKIDLVTKVDSKNVAFYLMESDNLRNRYIDTASFYHSYYYSLERSSYNNLRITKEFLSFLKNKV